MTEISLVSVIIAVKNIIQKNRIMKGIKDIFAVEVATQNIERSYCQKKNKMPMGQDFRNKKEIKEKRHALF